MLINACLKMPTSGKLNNCKTSVRMISLLWHKVNWFSDFIFVFDFEGEGGGGGGGYERNIQQHFIQLIMHTRLNYKNWKM